MKLFVRFAAILCLAACLLGLVSCSQLGEEAPEGMMIATCAGADYRLYVPTTWILNTSYGVSSAYRDLSRMSTVSVNRYAITDALRAEMNAAISAEGGNAEDVSVRQKWFHNAKCLPPVRERALDGAVSFTEDECRATTLGEESAWQFRYSALIEKEQNETLQFLQVVTEHNQAFYVFSFTATTEMYDMFSSDVERMLKEFIFADAYELPENLKQPEDDGSAPEGMQPASGKDVAYRLYVPQSWELKYDETVYSAFVPADRTSVSVVPYMPNQDSISVREYFNLSRKQMLEVLGEDSFELISDTEQVQLGGRTAKVFEYRLTIGGKIYHYRQYIAAYKSMIYSLTYTASEDCYTAHLGELESIVSAFVFR